MLLHPFRETDYDDLFEFLSQLEHDEFEGYPGISYENGKEQLLRRIDSEEYYAVELTETGKVIGNIYCGKRDFEAVELGYIVNKRFQKKGYAAEALSAAIERLFASGAHRLFAECDPRDEVSARLLEKVGMKREAHLRQNLYFRKDANGDPVWKDTYVYALLKSDCSRPERS